jgi:hypothetical protein
MTDRHHPSRRRFIGSVSALALAPMASALSAQEAPPSFAEFAEMCRSLAGFDVLPRPLARAAAGVLSDMQKRALVDGSEAAEDLRRDLLKMLYTGVHSPEQGEMNRLAYAEALMYAVIEDSVNVPSYCGGVPGYWAEKPESA